MQVEITYDNSRSTVCGDCFQKETKFIYELMSHWLAGRTIDGNLFNVSERRFQAVDKQLECCKLNCGHYYTLQSEV